MNRSKFNEVIFIPWVGENYEEGGLWHKRILALGDSHYCESNDCKTCGVLGSTPKEMGDCRNFTGDTVRSFLDVNSGFGGWKNTFKRFSGLLAGGHKTTDEEDSKIWEGIAFYNFVQTAILQGPRTAYTEEAYNKSLPLFWSVIDQLNPQLVLVWGARVWDALPPDGWTWIDLGIEGDIAAGKYTNKNTAALFLLICHPSAALSYEKWTPIVKRAIELA